MDNHPRKLTIWKSAKESLVKQPEKSSFIYILIGKQKR